MANNIRMMQNADLTNVGMESQFYARGDAVAELQAGIVAREEKTARLREARLAKDRRDLIAATAAKLAQRKQA
jgi:hypothetical protein